MSKYSARDPETGKFGDIVCRKHPVHEHWYLVYVGERNIGDVNLDTGQRCWMAISNAHPDTLRGWRSTRGFAKRRFAIEYLLRACGIWPGSGTYAPPTGEIQLYKETEL